MAQEQRSPAKPDGLPTFLSGACPDNVVRVQFSVTFIGRKPQPSRPPPWGHLVRASPKPYGRNAMKKLLGNFSVLVGLLLPLLSVAQNQRSDDGERHDQGYGTPYGRWEGRLSAEDQGRFDSYYSRWQDYCSLENWLLWRPVNFASDLGLSIPADALVIRRISLWPRSVPQLFFKPSNFEHRAILRKVHHLCR